MSELDRSNEPDAPDLQLTTNELFDLLADGRRRAVLRYVLERSDEVRLEELSEEVANGETGSTGELPEQLSIELHHAHLPKLADAGLVRYDPESWAVEPLAAATELAPLLAGLDE